MVTSRFRRHARVLLVLVLLPSAATAAGVMVSAAHPAGHHQDVGGLVHGHGHIAGTPDHEHNATFGAGIAHAAQREVAHLTTAALPPIAADFHPRWRSSTLPPHPAPAPRFQILRI